MKFRHWKAALAAGIALPLGACGLFDRKAPEPCPRVAILADTASVTQFRPGAGRDLTDVTYEAEITGFKGACEYKDRGETVVVTAALQIVATRGPAGSAEAVSLPFFVAVADRGQSILAKEVFQSRIEFKPGRRRAGVEEEMEQKIPLRGRRGTDYEILVGFQLDPGQLDYNRRKRGGN